MLNGFPISAKLPDDLGIGERFWYWRGASGQTYIHSIYPAGSCPPLPGAAATLNLSERGDVAEAAANLFGHLRRLDAMFAPGIAVMPIPSDGLGEAINDRLMRASAPRPSNPNSSS